MTVSSQISHGTTFADGVDLDQTARNVESDLDQHHPLGNVHFDENHV